MADIRALVHDEQSSFQGSSFQGTWIARIAHPVPVSQTSPVYVVIPDVDPSIKWGPILSGRWNPKSVSTVINVAEGAEGAHNITVMVMALPAYGDEALVTFDNRNNLWMVSYV